MGGFVIMGQVAYNYGMKFLTEKKGLFWTCAEYIVYAFILLFPFINPQGFLYGGTSFRSATLIFTALLLMAGFVIHLFKKNSTASLPKSPIFLAVVLYFVSLVASAFVGFNFSTSFWSVVTRTTGIWYFLHLGFVIYVLWGLMSDRIRQNRILLVFIASSALFSFLALMGPEGANLIFTGYVNDGFTFGNTSFGAMYLLAAFLCSVYYVAQAEQRKWWMYILPVIIFVNPYFISASAMSGDFSYGLAGEARTSSYAAVLSIIGVFALWGVSKIKSARAKSITLYSLFGAVIVIASIASFSLLSQNGALRKIYLSEATAARPLLWEMSGKVITQRPVLGWGTDNFEKVLALNYDNRLLNDEYGREAWFDRTHNVLIDQTIDNGIVGMLFYIIIYIVGALTLIYVIVRSGHRGDRALASVLLVYVPIHFIELQTAFDTTISYFILAIMLALSAVLYDRTRQHVTKSENEWGIPAAGRYVIGGIIGIFAVWSFIFGWLPFVRAQIANGYVRTIGSSEKRIPEYPKLFGSPIDNHSFLWRISTDFQRGIAENTKVLSDPAKVASLKREILIFEEGYKKYIQDNPRDVRAHLNLADILIYERLFDVDKLQEAQNVLDSAIAMAPQIPQAYWMKSVAYIYMKKFDLAREYAKKGLALNPEIRESKEVVQYVEESIKNFPEIDLFFFKQI